MLKKKKMSYVSKHDSNQEKQVILLIISNGDTWNGQRPKLHKSKGWWHYLAVKKTQHY